MKFLIPLFFIPLTLYPVIKTGDLTLRGWESYPFTLNLPSELLSTTGVIINSRNLNEEKLNIYINEYNTGLFISRRWDDISLLNSLVLLNSTIRLNLITTYFKEDCRETLGHGVYFEFPSLITPSIYFIHQFSPINSPGYKLLLSLNMNFKTLKSTLYLERVKNYMLKSNKTSSYKLNLFNKLNLGSSSIKLDLKNTFMEDRSKNEITLGYKIDFYSLTPQLEFSFKSIRDTSLREKLKLDLSTDWNINLFQLQPKLSISYINDFFYNFNLSLGYKKENRSLKTKLLFELVEELLFKEISITYLKKFRSFNLSLRLIIDPGDYKSWKLIGDITTLH